MTDYNNVDEEVAAAEAALKAAQDRLEAARAKQAQARAGIGVDNSWSPAGAQPFQSASDSWAAGSQATGSQPTGSQTESSSWAYAQSAAQPFQANYTYQAGQTYAPPYSGAAPQQPSGFSSAAPQTKDHVAAGLLAIFLGCLGIHKFYLGYNTPGFIMLAITIIGSVFSLGIAGVVMLIISIVEGIIYLSKSQTEFERIYVFGEKEWF